MRTDRGTPRSARRSNGSRALVVIAWVASLGAHACCNDVEATRCFEWAESETCPSPEEAAAKELADVDAVTSDGTYWPAHAYTVDGVEIPIAATCCYETRVEQCTTELH